MSCPTKHGNMLQPTCTTQFSHCHPPDVLAVMTRAPERGITTKSSMLAIPRQISRGAYRNGVCLFWRRIPASGWNITVWDCVRPGSNAVVDRCLTSSWSPKTLWLLSLLVGVCEMWNNYEILLKLSMSLIIHLSAALRNLRNHALALPVGRSYLVPSLSSFTTSHVTLKLDGSIHTSPASRNRITLVLWLALSELVPSLWNVTVRLSTTYYPELGNLKLKNQSKLIQLSWWDLPLYMVTKTRLNFTCLFGGCAAR